LASALAVVAAFEKSGKLGWRFSGDSVPAFGSILNNRVLVPEGIINA